MDNSNLTTRPSIQFECIISQLSPAIPRSVVPSDKGLQLFLGASRKVLVTGSLAEGGYLVQVKSINRITNVAPRLQAYKPVSKTPEQVDAVTAVRHIIKALKA